LQGSGIIHRIEAWRVEDWNGTEWYNVHAKKIMCGAYGFSVKDAKEVYDRFNIENTLENFKPRFNVRPGQMNPVITAQDHNEISRMFWGLLYGGPLCQDRKIS